MKVTVCQLPDDRGEFERAWEGLKGHVSRAGSDLVVLPEMPFYGWFCTGREFSRPVWDEAVKEHEKWGQRVGELGAKAVLWTAPVDRGERRANVGHVWEEGRGAREVHTKRYLPNEEGYYEATWYQRGEGSFVPFGAAGARVGVLICTDMWAMPRARGYGKEGVSLLAVPRCTPKGSVEKWVAGGRVAGVVAGAYCASSNRSGVRGGLEFGGKGWVAGPDGDVLGSTSEGEPFVTADVDLDVAERAKLTYPRDALEPD